MPKKVCCPRSFDVCQWLAAKECWKLQRFLANLWSLNVALVENLKPSWVRVANGTLFKSTASGQWRYLTNSEETFLQKNSLGKQPLQAASCCIGPCFQAHRVQSPWLPGLPGLASNHRQMEVMEAVPEVSFDVCQWLAGWLQNFGNLEASSPICGS